MKLSLSPRRRASSPSLSPGFESFAEACMAYVEATVRLFPRAGFQMRPRLYVGCSGKHGERLEHISVPPEEDSPRLWERTLPEIARRKKAERVAFVLPEWDKVTLYVVDGSICVSIAAKIDREPELDDGDNAHALLGEWEGVPVSELPLGIHKLSAAISGKRTLQAPSLVGLAD